jgi:hypothetical protein
MSSRQQDTSPVQRHLSLIGLDNWTLRVWSSTGPSGREDIAVPEGQLCFVIGNVDEAQSRSLWRYSIKCGSKLLSDMDRIEALVPMSKATKRRQLLFVSF